MATTFNPIANAGKPAPRWYRVSKRILYLIMGGSLASGTLDRFGVPAHDQTLIIGWVLTLAESVGIALANGEEYTTPIPEQQQPQ